MQNRIYPSPSWSGQDDPFVDEWYDDPPYDWDDPSLLADENDIDAPAAEMQIYIGIAVFLFVMFVLARNNPLTAGAQLGSGPSPQQHVAQEQVPLPVVLNPTKQPDPHTFTAPYEKYVITQGLHGYSYGHAAIDLASGKGSPVLSPINGEIMDVYIDKYGNPTIIIENEIYRVTMLHGEYHVRPGERVSAGDPVGFESNLGYTTDINGVRCSGRSNCGFHTHLNVYDKNRRENVNPLRLFERE